MAWSGRAIAAGCLALGLATAASAQSLGDVAKREAERRGTVKAPAKTYTNGNLTPDFTTPPALPAQPAPPAPPAQPAQPAEEPPDETYWRRQARAMNARLAEARRAMANVPNPATDAPNELARVEEYVAKAKARLARAEEDYQLFLMQADVAKVPKAWIQ